MSKKALIVFGGWDGHEPKLVSKRFQEILEANDFEVIVSDDLEVFSDLDNLKSLDLIIPIWTMGELDDKKAENVQEAVASGVGIAGCHGGMCDSFRNNVRWQFMVGGQWVAHPGSDSVKYMVNIKKGSSPIVEGINDFQVISEQYYLHVDPAIKILATSRFPTVTWYHSSNGEVDVPVMWTKKWGFGRVFYSALGHHNDVFDIPEAIETMKRGLLWAAEGKKIAIQENADISIFKNDAKMF